jgi:hypothetical protein
MPLPAPSSSRPGGRRPAPDGEPRGDVALVVQLRHETLVEVAQRVHRLAVAGLGGDDLDLGLLVGEEAADAHQRPGGAEPGDDMGHFGRSSRISGPVVR